MYFTLCISPRAIDVKIFGIKKKKKKKKIKINKKSVDARLMAVYYNTIIIMATI